MCKGDIDVIDVDEGLLRRILMLMKVVFYVRYSFFLNLICRRKVYLVESIRNYLLLYNSFSLSFSLVDF